MDWQPIETCPPGVHVLLYFPQGERGNGGMETATLYADGKGDKLSLDHGWTHGGANAGSDFDFYEEPTHWRPLPTDTPPATASIPQNKPEV